VSPEEHDYLAAEARARKRIDEKLVEAGWKVQDRAKANLYAGQGVALREFVHGEGHGRSDCALYVDRQLVGVLEAKPDGTTLTEVVRVTIGRRLLLRSCDENPLAGFVTR
jgi:type I restriction enzyme, R subunit